MARGSKPGERRGGRKPGVPNKLTRDIKEMAAQYGPQALMRIVELASSQDPRVSLAASTELLNRAYGKPMQPSEHSGPDGKGIPFSINVSFVKPGEG